MTSIALLDLKLKKFSEQIIKEIQEGKISNRDQFSKRKRTLCVEIGIEKVPTNSSIFSFSEGSGKKVKEILLMKPVRTISGVATIACMTKPFNCPHGTCIFCPGGLNSPFGDVPQSYTGKEPSTMRAIRNNYDSYLIAMNRLETYTALGHCPEKIEVIIQGGTFPAMSRTYQIEFVSNIFKALNDFSETFYNKNEIDFKKFNEFFELPFQDIKSKERNERINSKLLTLKGEADLKFEQKRNEFESRIKCVALCIETKPDNCFEKHINEMLELGTTRVEIGVQSLENKILKKTNRGHSVEDSIKATQLMRDSFLKIGYHLMPGLPDSTPEKNVQEFKELFSNPDFKPDSLKIYPCMVLQGTGLHQLWEKGLFNPISTEQAAKIIAEGKRFIPKYCRVMRIQRDIPTNQTEAGVENTNLRQFVELKQKELGIKCKCIRCREPKGKEIDFNAVKILSESFEANNSEEIFISVEDTVNDLLLGFCRLRIPFKPFRKEITENTLGIRELHVYGQALALGEKSFDAVQHKGFGQKLLEEAEKISREKFDAKKLCIISGIGARAYYKKFGYTQDGVYVSKKLI